MVTTMSIVTESAPQLTLLATDRCDKCGAQAIVEARNKMGLTLLFCGHHGREAAYKLLESNFALTATEPGFV